MNRIFGGAWVALACIGIGTANGADRGELWEVTTQVNMAGMPAGMGAHTSRVCNETGEMQTALFLDPKHDKARANLALLHWD